MQESYGEGLATRAVPESCAVGREAGGEALTGGSVSRAIEPRNGQLPGACAVSRFVGHVRRIALARPFSTWRGLRPRAYVDTPHAGCGRSQLWSVGDGHPVRAVNPKGARRR